MDETVEAMRREVDAIDGQILSLMARRLETAKATGRAKKRAGIAMRDKAREGQVVAGAKAAAARHGALDPHSVEMIFRQLISDGVQAQEGESTAVAFQGERGAFSEQAARAAFPGCAPRPFRTFRAAFEAVESGEADFALVPVENSVEGGVNEVHDLLAEKGLRAVGEALLRVRHCLVAMQGTELDGIAEVYSHPQALGQCQSFLKSNLPHARQVPFYDTAGAAKMIAAQEMEGAAAIASECAAYAYGLDVLRSGIEDSEINTTRFISLSGLDARTHQMPSLESMKTSIVFSLSHSPSALSRALEPFAKRSLNLTRIESRPSKQTQWEYVFFLDFEGDSQSGPGFEAVGEMRGTCQWLKVLGTYPKAAGAIGEKGVN